MLIDTSIIEYFSNEMILIKANARKNDSLTARKYNVSAYPTFVLTDNKGKEIDRIVGYLPAKEFLAKVDDYMHGIGTLDDLLAKVDSSKDRTLYFEIADKYKYRGAPDEAKSWFEKVITDGKPTDSLSGEARFALADMMLRSKEYVNSIAAFKEIKKDFKGTPLDEAASIYIPYVTMKKGDTLNAIKGFEQFIKDFPESDDAKYATKTISELKGEVTESK